MPLETVSIALSAATLIVVGAAAIAAIVQLRHLRASNQLSALLGILDQWNQPHLQAAYAHLIRDLPAKLADEEYLRRLRAPGSRDRANYPELLICDLWEQVGTYTKHGLIDERILLDIISGQVVNAWQLTWPVTKILRERSAADGENFEYLAVRSLLWSRRFADGLYPRGMPRMAELQPPDPDSADRKRDAGAG
jgi:hypothetical protein